MTAAVHTAHGPSARMAACRWMAGLVALVMLLGALITPWGLAKSHGSAAISALHHGEPWDTDDGHGHSHEGDAPATAESHAHHAGDHSHDKAHALPLGLTGWGQAVAVWRERSSHPWPWPSLDGLERPPRA